MLNFIPVIVYDKDHKIENEIKKNISSSNFLKLVGITKTLDELKSTLKKNRISIIYSYANQNDDIDELFKSVEDCLLPNPYFPPFIVLICNSTDLAHKAYEKGIFDFLTLPLDDVRFSNCTKKVCSFINRYSKTSNKSFFVKVDHHYARIYMKDILWVEALKDYVIIKLKNNRYILHRTMKDMEVLLPPDQFVRIHRSYIVNINKIDKIKTSDVYLKDKKLPVSRNYKNQLINSLYVI